MTQLQTMLQMANPDHLTPFLEQAGLWGPVIYIAIIILSVVISQIPGAPLAIAAGAIWDPLLAGLYTLLGGFGGALIAYGLGKQMGQTIIKALTGKTLTFSSDRSEGYLGWLVFLTRLLPVFSFDLISYGAGITGLSLPIYASATFLGMLPSTLLLTYVGDSIHFSGQIMGLLVALFIVLFMGIPALLHRYNWLDMNSIVRWE
ncbi:MAG: TVP38/TMEM64 family protein [Merismopedia sp. SIO2A8]|nr:TVP38/TMEM64 family protein [Symploca sp. SIO2B6]NET47512.1 TVP38/TMEM64 family protein [Merismopedia sp. SIO2A8]